MQASGSYTVTDESEQREISDAPSFKSARYAAQIHLCVDGEEPPLRILAPDGVRVATAELDSCGRFTLRTNSYTRIYERREGVEARWGTPE